VIRRAVAPVVLLALAAPVARAANKDLERLQIQVASLQAQVVDLQRSNDDSKREIQRLNEQLAEQTALVKKALQDQRTQGEAVLTGMKELSDRMAEVATRLQTAQAAPPPVAPAPSLSPDGPGTPGAAPSPAPAANAPPPKELYSQAYADYARGNYDLAIQGFQEYLKNYPGTDFSDNAQYWVGESLYGKQRYNEAIEAWNALLRDFPSSDKLPDARVKKGMALEKLGRRSQALLEYRYVVDRYPNSQAARVARDRLNPQQ
jgi:tol-pal system protein YbgF